jgi:hypothetical protein
MAFVTPTNVTVGSVLTASKYNQEVVANGLAGQPIFTNEAGRDAAIPSPYEGQRVYLTAPTVPAATGTTTAVPTGVTTIYNGSVWVCTTELGASSATDATTTSASFVTTLTSDGTAVAVTLVTGTTAAICLGFVGNVSGPNTQILTYSVSGATTVAAADENGLLMGASATNLSSHRSQVITGLTAGTNTFTLNYRTTGGTATYVERWLMVNGVA